MSLPVESMQPVIVPSQYLSGSDVVAWRSFSGGNVIVEVFERMDGSYGFRFMAWVAWRDAGGEVRNHTWHRLDSQTNAIVDTQFTAQKLADVTAAEFDLRASDPWVAAA